MERTERLAERRALEEKTHVIITFVHELQKRTTQKGHKLSTYLSPSAAAMSNVYHNFSGATACEQLYVQYTTINIRDYEAFMRMCGN